jgi:hypothetical protein
MGIVLGLALLGVVVAVYFADACSGVDWEFLQTKHYWSAENWYYGGYAGQYFETPRGYRAVISEGVCNYTNIAALAETVPAAQARHPVQGFPGTERLATPFLLSILFHLPGETADVWRAFWQANVLLWILSVILAYRVAALYFADDFSPWFAAILVGLYPALTLTFNGIKQQSLGTVYLLLGIYLFEGRLRKKGPLFAAAALTALLFLGQFADGGWCFLAVFLFVRALWLPGRERGTTLLGLCAAVLLSVGWFAWLGHAYHLPSAFRSLGFSPLGMARESAQWLLAWCAGRDVSELKFLNFPGFVFFTSFWPLICRSFLLVHGPLVAIAIAGLFLDPRSRMFALLAVPLLLVGEIGFVACGWVFSYGYVAFPAGLMVILAASAVLGSLAERRSVWPRLTALALAGCACWCLLDLKKQAGIYFGGDPAAYTRHVEVRFGDDDGRALY